MSKRRRTDLRSFGGVSDTKLCELLGQIRSNPALLADAAKTRFQIQRVDEKTFEEFRLTIPLRKIDGGDFIWHVAHPLRLLAYYCKHSDAFRSLFDKHAQTRGADHTYRLIMYYDEVTPGNLLRLDNARKFWAVYCSCLDFGEALQQSDAWLPIGMLRTAQSKLLAGNFAAAFAGLIRSLDPLETATVVLPTAGPRLIRATVHNHLGDEAALKRGLDVKGSAGTLPCIKCRNVMYSRAVAAADDYIITIACGSPTRFDLQRDEDVWSLADRLARQAGRVTKRVLAEEEQVAGINYNPRSVLFDGLCRERLRPIGTLTYDSMHIWFSGGIANEELLLLMGKLNSIGVSWEMVGRWFRSSFQYPTQQKRKMVPLHRCFHQTRMKASRNSGEFKAQASEVLALVPMLNYFVLCVVEPLPAADSIRDALDSFHRLAEVVALLQRAKRVPDAPQVVVKLREVIMSHFAAYVRAHGAGGIKWKRHAAFHIPDQVARDGRLIDSFPMERKHQLPKGCAAPILNTAAFERTVLLKTVQAQLHGLRSRPTAFDDGLVGKHTSLSGVDVALALHWQGTTVHQGDIVFVDESEVARIMDYSMCIKGNFVVSFWDLHFVSSQLGSSTWRKAPRPSIQTISL